MHAEKQDYGEEGKEGARSRGEKFKTRVKEEFCFRCQREFCIFLVGGLTRSMVSFMYMIQGPCCVILIHIYTVVHSTETYVNQQEEARIYMRQAYEAISGGVVARQGDVNVLVPWRGVHDCKA